jgi:hypothetical protein
VQVCWLLPGDRLSHLYGLFAQLRHNSRRRAELTMRTSQRFMQHDSGGQMIQPLCAVGVPRRMIVVT